MSILLFLLTFSFLFQTLTELNLEKNNIGDIGAQYLAKSLETHQVNYIYFVPIFFEIFIRQQNYCSMK